MLLKGDYRGAVLLLLLTPTSEMEVQQGMLNLDILTEWVSQPSLGQSDDQNHSSSFFRILAEKWEIYREEITAHHNTHTNNLNDLPPNLQPNGNNPDDRNNDVPSAALGYNDDDDLVEKEEDDPLQWMSLNPADVETTSSSTTSPTTSSTSSVSTHQWHLIESRLQCISDLLSTTGQAAFVYPRSTAMLQGKLYSAIKEEISLLQRQQQPQQQQPQQQQAEASTSSSSSSQLENIEYFRVFSTLQKNIRLLFVNAYQR